MFVPLKWRGGFNKSPNDWLKTQAAKDYIEAVSAETKICVSDLVITRKGGGSIQTTQGTWMHKDVAMEFARWLAPLFGLWCNRRIEELLTKGSVSMSDIFAPPTADIVKNDCITSCAGRAVCKDFSLSEVAHMILWGNKAMPRRMLIGWMYEHNWLTTHSTGVPYPTDAALAMGLFIVTDRCMRGQKRVLKKPRVRVTMDGANYFISVLQHGCRQ